MPTDPDYKKPGDLITSDDWNRLVDRIRALEERLGIAPPRLRPVVPRFEPEGIDAIDELRPRRRPEPPE
jgi:hypothetical protein